MSLCHHFFIYNTYRDSTGGARPQDNVCTRTNVVLTGIDLSSEVQKEGQAWGGGEGGEGRKAKANIMCLTMGILGVKQWFHQGSITVPSLSITAYYDL